MLRYKAATQEDVDFMEFYTANKNNVGTLADSCFLPPKVHAAKLLEQKSKKGQWLPPERHHVTFLGLSLSTPSTRSPGPNNETLVRFANSSFAFTACPY